jgi:hypothetical protein
LYQSSRLHSGSTDRAIVIPEIKMPAEIKREPVVSRTIENASKIQEEDTIVPPVPQHTAVKEVTSLHTPRDGADSD